MRLFFIFVSIAAFLIGCASTPEKTTDDANNTGTVGAATQGVDSQPLQRPDQPAARPLTASERLRDASSPLSVRSVYFNFDSYAIQEEYKPALIAHARFLTENPKALILIQGNTDERGTREYNLVLGQKRADAVKKMMILLGARDDQIESVSLGEEHPVDSGQSESAYAKNRRADILYRFQDVREF